MPKYHSSENIVVEAPMSFTGATKRIWRPLMVRSTINPLVKWIVVFPLVLVALGLTYCLILGWYAVFGILLVPYRLIRRSHRKERQAAARHREMMEAMKK